MKTTRKAWLRAGKRLLPRGRCVSNHLLSGLAVKIACLTMTSMPLSSGEGTWGGESQVAGLNILALCLTVAIIRAGSLTLTAGGRINKGGKDMKNMPEVNDRVTIARKDRRDRSYQDVVWIVIAVNRTHTQLRAAKSRSPLAGKIIILTEEYDFSDAESFDIDQGMV